jgi:DNA-binding transcriptional LysR family regulator
MEWSLDQLRQFVATAECGSISAAARKLGKAQSAVSAAISLLEIDLGVTLFDRSHRSAKLTEEGRLLRLEAVEVLRQAEELGKRAQFMAGGNDARLVIAMDEALPRTAISTLLRELAQKFPETELTLLNGTAAEMMDFVDQERAGLAFHFLITYELQPA